MRHSPCRAHYEQTMAATQPAPGTEQAIDQNAANAYELMLLKLAEDKRRLKDVKSMERKAEVKAQILPDYLPWIAGVLESEAGRQDDVLMTVFVWAIDIGNFELALQIGTYAIEHKLVMPDQYERDVPSVLAEELAEVAIKAADEQRAAMLATIEQAISLTDGLDMHDVIRAKLYKAYGYALRANDEPKTARLMLARALELDTRAGVKKDIERLDTVIKNLPAENEEAAHQAASDNANG